MKKLKVITYWTENGVIDKIEFDRLDIPWWMPKWLFFKALSDKLNTLGGETDFAQEMIKSMEEKIKENPKTQNMNTDDLKIAINCYRSKLFIFIYSNDEDVNFGLEMMAY